MRVSPVVFLSVVSSVTLFACHSPVPSPEPEPGAVRTPLLSVQQVTGATLPPYTLSLTYDDGPDTFTGELSAFLRDNGIPATFFVNGCRLEGAGEPDERSGNCSGARVPTSTLSALVTDGHRVANHTHDHVRLAWPAMASSIVVDQIAKNQDLLEPFLRDGYALFRPPYNAWESATESAVNAPGTGLGHLAGPFFYDVDGRDYSCRAEICSHLDLATEAGENTCADACAARYIASLDALPNRNGIVQLHDRNENAVGTRFPLKVTQRIVATLRSRPEPYVFAPLDAIPGVRGQFDYPKPISWTRAYSDAGGFGASRARYGSVRLVDVNGDGRADVCARDASGLQCGIAHAAGGFDTPTTWFGQDLRDVDGWDRPEYGSTLQFGDVDGDGHADLCGRGRRGVLCFFGDGARFIAPGATLASEFSDDNGWQARESRYGSIRVADVDGDGRADVCGRAPGGIRCSLSLGRRGFGAATTWLGTEFTDALGWDNAAYGTTMQFVRLTRAARPAVCGRGYGGIVCAQAHGSNPRFGSPALASVAGAFGDVRGFHLGAARYQSIRFADIDGDGLDDVCGRDATGITCAINVDGRFAFERHIVNTEFGDAQGWGTDSTGTTLMMGDVNGDRRADVCLRGVQQLSCMTSPSP